MIKTTGAGVLFRGDLAEILIDFITTTKTLRNLLRESLGEDAADVIITDLGKIAFLDDELSEKEFSKALDDIFDNSMLKEIMRRK